MQSEELNLDELWQNGVSSTCPHRAGSLSAEKIPHNSVCSIILLVYFLYISLEFIKTDF